MNAGQETLRVRTFVRITRNRTSLKVSWGASLQWPHSGWSTLAPPYLCGFLQLDALFS
jgi:hypothetical protein